MSRISGRPVRLASVKLGGPVFAHTVFVCCAAVWATGSNVAGSIPTGGILTQMCECVNSLRVAHLHMSDVIIPLWGSNLGRWP